MKSTTKNLTLRLLFLLLTFALCALLVGCPKKPVPERSSEETPDPVALGLVTPDQPEDVAAPTTRPEPEADEIMGRLYPNDSSEALQNWAAFRQTHRQHPADLLRMRYPNRTGVTCEFVEPNGEVECRRGGGIVSIASLDLPFLLNAEVASSGIWMQCSDGVCIEASSAQPVGRLQDEMASWMLIRCKWADVSTYSCP